MNSTKCAHELQKENSRDEQGAWKKKGYGWLTTDPRCYRYAALIKRKFKKIQTPRSGHGDPGLSEATQRVVR